MQQTSNRTLKFDGVAGHLFVGSGRTRAGQKVVAKNLTQPEGRLIIAQATGRLFYIGLEMKIVLP